MKIAVLADVHANLEALEAVLADLGDWPDRIVVAGDLIGYGPDPDAVVSRIKAIDALCVWGNHEGMLLGRLDMKRCIYAGIRAIKWTREVLHPENNAWLEALPLHLDVAPGVRMVHAAPGNVEKYITNAQLAADALQAAGPETQLLITGHTHQAALSDGSFWKSPASGTHPLPQRALLNPGAVGQSRDKRPLARYARLDLATHTVSFHELDYPWQETARKMKEARLVPLLSAPSSNLISRAFNAARTRWARGTTT